MLLTQSHRAQLTTRVLLFLVAVVTLAAGFYGNVWHAAETSMFLDHDHFSETLIIGRMIWSRQTGIFSAGGLTGAGIDVDFHSYGLNADQIRFHYRAYQNDLSFTSYSPYKSQIGGQGMFFSLLDRVVPLPSPAKLDLWHLLTSILSAIALSLVILWLHNEFGILAAFSALAFSLLAPWLTVFGRHLWWSLWAFYVPMIALMYVLRHEQTPTQGNLRRLGLVVFLSVFAKCVFNGYEYITATLVMMVVPLVYYAVLDKWTLRRLLQGGLVAVLGSGAAIVVSAVIVCFQVGAVEGSFWDGVRHLAAAFGRRTYSTAEAHDPRMVAGPSSATLAVLMYYLKGTFVDIGNYVATSSPFVYRFLFKIRYMYVLPLFAAMSIAAMYGGQARSGECWRRSLALVCATWFSLLAPLSWFIVFKNHAYDHPHLDNIVWHMPFTLFGFALCGWAVRMLVSAMAHGRRSRA